MARICKSAVDEMKAEGINVGLIRPITVWPFPAEAIARAASDPNVKAVLTVEMSAGQLVEDVRLAVNGTKPVELIGHAGSQVPTPEEIKAVVTRLRGE